MAETYNIYFGTESGNLSLIQAGLDSTSINMPTGIALSYATTYYWRVDAVNEYGTTTGDEWYFSSIPFLMIEISYILISGGSGSGPYDDPPGTEGTDWRWSGENNMLTVRRLVVAADSAIWYESE